MSMTLLLFTLNLLIILVSCITLYSITEALKARNKLIKSEDGLKKGSLYPLDLLKNIEGNEVRLVNGSDGMVLIFTSFGCNVCKSVYPYLEQIRNEYSNIQFHIVMLANIDEAKETINKYKLDNFLISLVRYEQLPDFGITGFPFTYLISNKGIIIEKGIVNYKRDFDLLISFLNSAKVS